jgi:predicted nucleotidyltransferase
MDPQVSLGEYRAIRQCEDLSEKKIAAIREKLECLNAKKSAKKFCIVTTGSYGRFETSAESDIDLFIVSDDDLDDSFIDEIRGEIEKIITKEVPKPSGDTNTFGIGVCVKLKTLLNNIGGNKDSNSNLTRRMLFLLEGKWLFNEERFKHYRTKLITKYTKKDSPDHQINKFFLNDIIRYYRTIATDFEYKIQKGKSWGLRNIKLLFSRKLLYFSGIIVVAETPDKTWEEKIRITEELLDLTPLRRIIKLSNTFPANIFCHYDTFLGKISDKKIRAQLDQTRKKDRNSNGEFANLRSLGQQFSLDLHRWLKDKYTEDHPIHHLLIF